MRKTVIIILFVLTSVLSWGQSAKKHVSIAPEWYEKYFSPVKTEEGFLVSGCAYNMPNHKVERFMAAVYDALSICSASIGETVSSQEFADTGITKIIIEGQHDFDFTMIRQAVDNNGNEYVLLSVTSGTHNFTHRITIEEYPDFSVSDNEFYFSPFRFPMKMHEETYNDKITDSISIGSYNTKNEYLSKNAGNSDENNLTLGFDKEQFLKAIKE